ncbi:altered inheritance of mitochondria protein 32 [[Candida] railenensis]|uniref:Altered inheritance of mitochondria protein 32 n=1 Tax=[Candida] railenensis TaxID=45579 RepID=A0A9P0QQ14_9ASCO|nr:altered inheritance of mitochondria protein 32 [[Candida] railenensis]
MLGRRLFSSSRGFFQKQLVEKCPPPTFDTGCTFCGIPSFPKDKQIDFDRDLAGTRADNWKHLLILSSGLTHDQWPSKIELQPGALSTELTHLKRSLGSPNHPVAISNIDMGTVPHYQKFANNEPDGMHTVLLYPDNKLIRFDKQKTEEFFKTYLRPKGEPIKLPYNPFRRMAPTITEPLVGADEEVVGKFHEEDFCRELVLICGHSKRDIRCGVLAPILKEEFVKVLEAKEVESVDVGYISHIGGHAYAGNVLYFGNSAFESTVWYGRVFPDKVQGIVEETVINGNVIKELYRG